MNEGSYAASLDMWNGKNPRQDELNRAATEHHAQVAQELNQRKGKPAKHTNGQMTDEMIALIKGMLARGDKSQDIAACFGINQARVAEIHHSMTRSPGDKDASLTKRAREITAAPPDELPPKGPYPTPFELHRAGNSVWQVRVALEHLQEKIGPVLKALSAAEIKPR